MQIDPSNIQGLHNLCVVYVERGKLTQALDCLQHAHKLAPHEDYILKHLKIVQQRLANLKQAPGMHHQKTIAFAKYDPTDFGGTTTETNTIDDSDQLDDMIVPPKSPEPIEAHTITAKTAAPSAAEFVITDKSSKNSNDNSCKGSTQQTECVAHVGHDKNTHTKTTTPPLPPKSTTSSSSPKRRSTTNNENRKFSDKSTISFDANNFIRKIDQQRINTNHRHRKRIVQESALPMFVHPYVHDMDDPSSGTS